MKWAILLLFTAAFCTILWIWQMDNHTSKTGYSRLKNSLDLATHDAAMQIDKNELARNGRIIFANNAQGILSATLQKNLRLDLNNYPVAPNMFRSSDQVRVLVFDKLESGCPNSAAGFPCTYNNTTYGYVDTIRGPSIVAIISMRHPRPFAFSADRSYIVGSSHEYKGY
ncbi:hypothetical protein [Paenibacillus abyssi]|uniref:Uncharacterized protein n=1 Tax=Paenibacillus abyssi TaxID=1340531 RepID=A0A917G2F5_9BACL|nr:hypothetical protein [Paenibacillus abyssi]GGG18846.1 hypothetical protein GCM10010916_39570 [Paenibacillus abyssi]